jgi:dihydrofolate reductase
MRKIMVAAFVSLDGVMQAPGGPEEDPTGGFGHGGWVVPYMDEVLGTALDGLFAAPFDLLLGRRTYDIFAAHWPQVAADPTMEGIGEGDARIAQRFETASKYVATHCPETLAWKGSEWLGSDPAARLAELRSEDGPLLLVQGSSVLIQALLANELVDELRLFIHPIVFGRGKRLFGDGTIPAAFRLVDAEATPTGVIIARYERAGDIITGSYALGVTSEAELARRRALGP